MSLARWFRRCAEKVSYRLHERRLKRMGLRRVRGEREYPVEPGTIEGIAPDHLDRYEQALPYCRGKTVLDYRCGVGYGTFMIAQVAARAVGYDTCRDALDWAAHYTARQDNLTFADRLSEEKFDCVTCFECIEHVPNPEEVLDWLAAHSAEYVFISTPDASGGRTGSAFHLREFTRSEFRDMLSSRFAIEEEDTQITPFGSVMIFRCRPL